MALPKWLAEMRVVDMIKYGVFIVPWIISIPVVNKAIAQVVTETVGERIGAVEQGLADSLDNQELLRQQLQQLQAGTRYSDGNQDVQLQAIIRLLQQQCTASGRVDC